VEGESAKITVNATDPEGEPLEYVSLSGAGKSEEDGENVFIFRATRDCVHEPFFGSHEIEFVVINESNVLSRVSRININI